MANKMLIDATHPEETRVVVVRGSRVEEFDFEAANRKQLPGTEIQEFLFDMRLSGVDRTFLVRVMREGARLNIIAGGTRKQRFARLQPDIVQALNSYKLEK